MKLSYNYCYRIEIKIYLSAITELSCAQYCNSVFWIHQYTFAYVDYKNVIFSELTFFAKLTFLPKYQKVQLGSRMKPTNASHFNLEVTWPLRVFHKVSCPVGSDHFYNPSGHHFHSLALLQNFYFKLNPILSAHKIIMVRRLQIRDHGPRI